MDAPVQYYRCDSCRLVVSRNRLLSQGSCKCGSRMVRNTKVTTWDKLIVKLFNR